jgi:branched-chain amino acid transport system permease protein
MTGRMELFQILINGVLLGGLYAVIGLGLSIYFGIMRVPHLAHGDLMVVGSYLAATLLVGGAGAQPLIAALVTIPVMFAVGVLLQRGVIGPAMGRGSAMAPLIVTFGISLISQNVLLWTASADPRTLPTRFATASLGLSGGLAIPVMYLVDFAVSLSAFGLVLLILTRTRLGRALRATSDDPDTVTLIGISPKRVYAIAAGLATVLAGLAGVLFAATFTFYPFTGTRALLVAFEVVVIGGLGSLVGTLVGGVLLGLAQVAGARMFGPSSGELAGHMVFLAVLLVRPQGLFPRTAL